MRYIDTGSRDASQTVARWLETHLVPALIEIRWQSGFFNAEPLGLFAPLLAGNNRLVHAVIGSNPPGTQSDAVLSLVQALGLPRANVRLGIVQYATGFFHPKTIHLRRNDGSQCAYVRSANLTGPGLRVHVEAGMILDTSEGDAPSMLNEIAAAIDAWFSDNRHGLHLVANADDVQRLTDEGVPIVPFPPEPPVLPAIAEADTEADEAGEDDIEDEADPRPTRPVRLPTLVDLPALPPPPVAPPAVFSPAPGTLVLLWQSKPLTRRDLTIPDAGGTNPTGSINLDKGLLAPSIDHRHYFRDTVFARLKPALRCCVIFGRLQYNEGAESNCTI